MIDNHLPISAIVVSRNEGHLLAPCLEALKFCDEIVVIDLCSTDNTAAVARKYASKVLEVAPEPFIEILHARFCPTLKHSWILLTDPDEVISQHLVCQIKDEFSAINSDSSIGAVEVPICFYFKNRKLRGTPWGGVKKRVYLVHKDRFLFSPQVHRGREVLKGFRLYSIEYMGRNYIHHYWMSSWIGLIQKHVRYLKNEGESRFSNGQRVNFELILTQPFKSFFYSFFSCKGFKDAFTGFGLSLFWSWYQSMAQIGLHRYQRKLNSNGQSQTED